MYDLEIDGPAQTEIAALPPHLLKSFAELLDVLDIAPWNGRPYGRDPAGPMRVFDFGSEGEAMAIYLIVERQRRVVVVRVTWA